jgi:TonB-linked SusC/RagA family outer membrane protein
MKHFKKLIARFVLLLFCVSVITDMYGQSAGKSIAGKVIDKTGEPLIGVSVSIKNTNKGTVTDIDGNYTLPATNDNAVLVFSYIGYTTVEQTVGKRNVINLTLEEDSKLLDEVVVVGYGVMRKRDLSGAVSQVKGDALLTGNPASSINQALQGKIAGVIVSQSDGTPGGGVNIQIRGNNTFTSNSQPLFIVDGIPFEPPVTPRSAENTDGSIEAASNALSFINPHDIESIEVLKDASATAIYGSRGANGVVMITTKKGAKGKPRIDFNSNFSVSQIRKKIDMLDGYSYANYRNEQQDNAAFYDGAVFNQYTYPKEKGEWRAQGNGYQYFPSPEDYLNPGWRTMTDANGKEWKEWVEGADWQDEIFQTAFSQEYNLSVSGAGESGSHLVSGNYTNQEGIIKGTGFERYTLRTNLIQKVNDRINVGLNMNYTNSKTNFAKGNSLDYSVLRSAIIYPSTVYAGDNSKDSEYMYLSANPRTYVTATKNVLSASSILSSAFATIDITDYLQFRQNLGLNNFFNERSTYSNRQTGEGIAGTVNGRGGYSDNRQSSFTSESMLTFNRTFNKIHQLNAVVAFTAEQSKQTAKVMTATQFPSDLTENYDMGAALLPGPLVTNTMQNRLLSTLGRINYVLLDRYIFTTSFRRDGSSKFAPANKYANFLSGAFAWRLSEEQFIKNLNVFDNLKLRLSFGQTGNQAIPDYRTLYIMKIANYPASGDKESGYTSAYAYNEDLKWETTDQYNAGLDFGFLKNRLTFTIDYYFKNTKDLLQDVKVPQSTGYISHLINQGRVTNEGLEFSVDYTVIDNPAGKFSWSVNGNLSFNRNRIADLETDQFAQRLWHMADNVFIQRNGCPIGAIYGYVEDGFYDNIAEVRADPRYAGVTDAVAKSMIGEIKLRDIDGNGEINASDKTIIGNTNPDYTFGITNNFKWQNFSFGFFLQGIVGNDIFNGNLMNVLMYSYRNIPVDAYNTRWTEENKANARWPKATTMPTRSLNISDRYVEDGSYLRLKNVNFGYRFNKPFQGVDLVDVNVSASNLLTWTNYSWYDPDVNAFGGDPSRKGVDIYAYPTSRTINLGIKVQF